MFAMDSSTFEIRFLRRSVEIQASCTHCQMGQLCRSEEIGKLLLQSKSRSSSVVLFYELITVVLGNWTEHNRRVAAEETRINTNSFRFASYQLGPERFRAPEVLFKPELAGTEYSGVSVVVFISPLKILNFLIDF